MKKVNRIRIHKKIRRDIFGTSNRPRLSVFKSLKRIYGQIIDDTLNKTLVSISDIKETGTKRQRAYEAGKKLATKATKLKIQTVVFDRGGFLFQGRIEEFAKGAREGGLKF